MMIWILVAILAYVYLIPGMYALTCFIDRAHGIKPNKNSMDIALMWPMLVMFVTTMVLLVLICGPYQLLLNGKAGLEISEKRAEEPMV